MRLYAWLAALIACVALGASGCDPEPSPRSVPGLGDRVAVPLREPERARCAWVRHRRVCYSTATKGGGAATHPTLIDASLGAPPSQLERSGHANDDPTPRERNGPTDVTRHLTLAPDLALRCEGAAQKHACQVIARRPFRCEADLCRQPLPRVPSVADWECADVGGVVVCRALVDEAAGVVATPPEPGWICGDTETRKDSSEGTPRICVNLAPDLPTRAEHDTAPRDGSARYECHYEYEPQLTRICRLTTKPLLGARCDGEGHDSCSAQQTCVSHLCMPRFYPEPSCWTDRDCPTGEQCVLATCTVGE